MEIRGIGWSQPVVGMDGWGGDIRSLRLDHLVVTEEMWSARDERRSCRGRILLFIFCIFHVISPLFKRQELHVYQKASVTVGSLWREGWCFKRSYFEYT